MIDGFMLKRSCKSVSEHVVDVRSDVNISRRWLCYLGLCCSFFSFCILGLDILVFQTNRL